MVVARGRGFAADELVDVSFGEVQTETVLTNGQGAFDLRGPVPRDVPPGPAQVVAVGQTSGLLAETSFLVRTNWSMLGGGPAHTGFNPYENV